MALLSRLFSTKKSNKQTNVHLENNERSTWKPFAFSKSQVRVLLYRECDWRGRKLLFDSNAVHRVLLEKTSCKLRFSNHQKLEKTKTDAFVEVTNGCGYQYTKPSSDATLFGEMMFGSVAMAFRGTSLKIHSIPNPERLMCTKVFPSPEVAHHNRSSDRSLEDSFGSSLNSMSDYYTHSGSDGRLESGPLDVPMGMSGACSSATGDSGFCGDFSIQTLSSVTSSCWTPVTSLGSSIRHGSIGRQSGSSLSSLRRRWQHSVNTSLELASLGQAEEPTTTHHRKTRLGLSVVIDISPDQHREMESFIFEHISIIETMVERLRHCIERAYVRKDVFVHTVYEGVEELSQALMDLFTLPRLESPMWLTLGLNTGDDKRKITLSTCFLQDMCQLISSLDTKATNFFVSTLLTGILTHHLGWVNTVWTPDNPQSSSSTDKNSSKQYLSSLAKSHPYNPLWAQLGDLYGALGSPPKVAKTIVTANGRKSDCVHKLLTVMTYFIRCGEVKKSVHLAQSDICFEDSEIVVCQKKSRDEMCSNNVPKNTVTSNVHLDENKSGPTMPEMWKYPRDDVILKDTVNPTSPKPSKEATDNLSCSTQDECCFVEVDHKSLNARLEILGQGGRPRRSGNLCSPAGAEWEVVEMEDVPPEHFVDLKAGEIMTIQDTADMRLRRETESSQTTRADISKDLDLNHIHFSGTSDQNTDVENRNSDGFHQVAGLKRTQSCRTKLKDMTENGHAGLYPNIDDLAKMENIRLDADSPYGDYNSTVKDVMSSLPPDEEFPQIVMEKVTKLCRVPTAAVLFHLEAAETEVKCLVQASENFSRKVVESERQTAASERSTRHSKNASPFPTEELDQGVVFVLGENEELKGIKHKLDRVKNNVGCDSLKNKSDVASNLNSVPFEAVLGNVSGPRIVTVKSDLIDLENESGYLMTEYEGESCVKPSTSTNSASMSRSCSINLPVARRNRITKVSRVSRRHTEIYCIKCKTILKEKRTLDKFPRDCQVESTMLKCEKCCDFRQNRDVTGLGNFRRTKSEKLDLNLIESETETRSLDEEASVYVDPLSHVTRSHEVLADKREENAMFEQYNPSDEEIVIPVNPNCVAKQVDVKEIGFKDLDVVELPLPSYSMGDTTVVGLAASLMGGVSDRYIPDLVLQGCSSLPIGWESVLRRDLAVTAKLPLLGQDITEAVCLVANTNTWEVQLLSSHSYVVDKPGTMGVRVGMSQLVANMLESLNDLFLMKLPPEQCLSHLENKLRELVLRSQALAELLLTTEFCNMESLTSTLDLEANDVPLLLAIATTHSPEIASRYGLSFI